MLKKKPLQSYNDGWVDIYRVEAKETSFGALVNVSSVEDLEGEPIVVRLAYAQKAKREQDLEFAERQSFTLSLKIAVRYREDIDPGCKAVINGKLFDISYIDPTKTEMFLYLQEI